MISAAILFNLLEGRFTRKVIETSTGKRIQMSPDDQRLLVVLGMMQILPGEVR